MINYLDFDMNFWYLKITYIDMTTTVIWFNKKFIKINSNFAMSFLTWIIATMQKICHFPGNFWTNLSRSVENYVFIDISDNSCITIQ